MDLPVRVWALALSCLAFPCASWAAAPREVPIEVNDLAWDFSNGRLWASVRGGTAIVAIDPLTGATGSSIQMGGEAGPLAISPDGTTLYAGVKSAAVVRRIDLATNAVVSSFALGTHPTFGPLHALDLAVQPGTNHVVAATRQTDAISTAEGVAIYDNGVMRPNTTPSGYVGRRVVFNDSGDRLFGYDNGTTGEQLEIIRVDAAGATLLALGDAALTGSHFVDGRLIGGGAYDPAQNRLRGTYSVRTIALTGGVEVDGVLREVYRATAKGILVFDLDTFASLGVVALPFFQGIDAPFERWGERSFALSVTNISRYVLIVDGDAYASDVDHDFLPDSADNCPETVNVDQLDADSDGSGDACDPAPRADPFPPLAQCANSLAAENRTISQLLAQLTLRRAEFAQLRVEVNQCIAVNDLDQDGEPNATDRCPGSLDFADETGCSRAQFCAAQPGSLCARADYLNDQPGVKNPFDCELAGGACAPF